MRTKSQMCITVSSEFANEIEKLVQSLPEKTISGKVQKATKSSIIELYGAIIHNYFDLDQLSMEYTMLDIIDGRRKNE